MHPEMLKKALERLLNEARELSEKFDAILSKVSTNPPTETDDPRSASDKQANAEALPD